MDAPQSLGTRIRGEQIVKPIVYGNTSESFGIKRDGDGHTHKWIVYLRPYKEEDLSLFIKKVHFKLHESYGNNQNRILNEPPFEISETGWGEFEIAIKIFFIDPQEKPITIYHILKLFPPPPNASFDSNFCGIVVDQANNKSVIAEFYDELVFQEPTTIMFKLLNKNISENLPISKLHKTNFEQRNKDILKTMKDAQIKINYEIKELTTKLKFNQVAMQNFQKDIEINSHLKK